MNVILDEFLWSLDTCSTIVSPVWKIRVITDLWSSELIHPKCDNFCQTQDPNLSPLREFYLWQWLRQYHPNCTKYAGYPWEQAMHKNHLWVSQKSILEPEWSWGWLLLSQECKRLAWVIRLNDPWWLELNSDWGSYFFFAASRLGIVLVIALGWEAAFLIAFLFSTLATAVLKGICCAMASLCSFWEN